MQKLSAEERASFFKDFPSWEEVEGRDAAKATFTFKDFNEAFGFMTRIAIEADKRDHHPEWFNVYNRVEVKMTTHDAGGVTAWDFDMANAMNAFATSS